MRAGWLGAFAAWFGFTMPSALAMILRLRGNGLLLTALYPPVWTSAIFGPADFALGIVAFLLLAIWAVPPWLVVIFGALVATAIAMM